MAEEFVICSKCGTRNFANDKICGVCSSEIEHFDDNTTENNKPPIDYLTLFLKVFLIIGLFFLCYALYTYNDKPENKNTEFAEVTKTTDTPTPKLQATPTNTEIIEPLESSITKIELNAPRLFIVHVRINKKLSEYELVQLAKNAKATIEAPSEKGRVFFRLEHMYENNVAWAAVDFTPTIKVRFLGQSIEDEEKIKSALNNITDYVGLWENLGVQGDIIIRIRNDKKRGYVFEYISSTDYQPSDIATPLIKKVRNGITVYKDTENEEQFFVVEKNGDLSAYDNDGMIEIYKRLK